jgi:hypothetical protein
MLLPLRVSLPVAYKISFGNFIALLSSVRYAKEAKGAKAGLETKEGGYKIGPYGFRCPLPLAKGASPYGEK